MALGMDKPFIVLNSGIVELMDPEEIRFVIGHELGHVLSGHAVYNTMLWVDKPRDEAGVESAPADRKYKQPTPDGKGREVARPVNVSRGGGQEIGVGFTCYVPGRALSDFRPLNAGVLVPAGSDVSWTIHYTPNGTELTDRPEVGLTISSAPPQRLLIEAFGGTDPSKFAIPPNDGNYGPTPAEVTFLEDVDLVWMSPHMHLRGKDMKYTLVYPDGREQVVLNVPRYDFNWQLGYQLAEPLKVPKGSRMTISGHYDNSSNNKFNPDPGRTVYQGNMTWEEMFTPFFAIIVDKGADPSKLYSAPFATGGA